MCICVSADMSPYCSAHDEWLIMKLFMYVGYHDANNVSNFGGDPVTQLNFKNVINFFIYAVLRARRTIAVTRPLVVRLLLRDARRLLEYGRPTPASNGHTSLSTALVFSLAGPRDKQFVFTIRAKLGLPPQMDVLAHVLVLVFF